MTEFKAVKMTSIDEEYLQDFFDNGWEYVNGFSQTVSAGPYGSSKYGDILIILKKEKIEL